MISHFKFNTKKMSIYSHDNLPVIDVSELRQLDAEGNFLHPEQARKVCKQIGEACERFGFFYASNHGIEEQLINKLMTEGRQFFAKPVEYKNRYHMKNSKVYRGYFEVGGGMDFHT